MEHNSQTRDSNSNDKSISYPNSITSMASTTTFTCGLHTSGQTYDSLKSNEYDIGDNYTKPDTTYETPANYPPLHTTFDKSNEWSAYMAYNPDMENLTYNNLSIANSRETIGYYLPKINYSNYIHVGILSQVHLWIRMT
jgi:hypothetical protein